MAPPPDIRSSERIDELEHRLELQQASIDAVNSQLDQQAWAINDLKLSATRIDQYLKDIVAQLSFLPSDIGNWLTAGSDQGGSPSMLLTGSEEKNEEEDSNVLNLQETVPIENKIAEEADMNSVKNEKHNMGADAETMKESKDNDSAEGVEESSEISKLSLPVDDKMQDLNKKKMDEAARESSQNDEVAVDLNGETQVDEAEAAEVIRDNEEKMGTTHQLKEPELLGRGSYNGFRRSGILYLHQQFFLAKQSLHLRLSQVLHETAPPSFFVRTMQSPTALLFTAHFLLPRFVTFQKSLGPQSQPSNTIATMAPTSTIVSASPCSVLSSTFPIKLPILFLLSFHKIATKPLHLVALYTNLRGHAVRDAHCLERQYRLHLPAVIFCPSNSTDCSLTRVESEMGARQMTEFSIVESLGVPLHSLKLFACDEQLNGNGVGLFGFSSAIEEDRSSGAIMGFGILLTILESSSVACGYDFALEWSSFLIMSDEFSRLTSCGSKPIRNGLNIGEVMTHNLDEVWAP